MAEKRSNPRKPDKLGKYEILDILGSGGMGVVYRGRDQRLGREVAIKQLTEGFRNSPDMLGRFYAEATKQASLHHNNIVVVFDAGDQDGEPYIVMEYVDGETLDKKIKDRKRLDLKLVLSIVEQVCLALAYAHRKGLIHRDVKPANVIVQPDATAKLFDFGISRDDSRMDKTMTHTGVMVGTPPYMAPERFKGAAIDGRSDLFSAGVLLYELLTGKRPFDAADVPAVVDQILRAEPPAPSTLLTNCPPSLDAIIARALAKSPHDRYANGDDMAMDLRGAAQELTRGQVAELLAQAERHFEQRQFLPAQSALHKILILDSQHLASKRLLQQVDRQITQQERDRKARELARMAHQACADREWDRALTLCNEALVLTPSSATLVSLRQSVVDGRQIQEKVSQLLFESASARKAGQLDRAISQANTAHELDPSNSQVMALCRELEQEAEERLADVEFQKVLASFHEQVADRQYEDAALLLDRAQTISPENTEVLRAKDELATALADERRKTLVRRIEDKVALTTTVDKLRTVQTELAEALKEFPHDPALIRLKLTLGPRIRQMENTQLVREVSRRAAEQPPEEALIEVREALTRVPGNDQLMQLEAMLAEIADRTARERILAQRLTEGRQLIDDGLFLEAARTLERSKAEGYTSYELDGLLEIAKSSGSEKRPQELVDRTYTQAKKLIDEGAYANATQILQRALRDTDEPPLRRQLEEASRKQIATTQEAASAMQNVEQLIGLGLFAEAVAFLETQPVGVKRLPEVDVALRRAKLLRQGEEETFRLMGRCYAQLGSKQGLEDLKNMLTADLIDDEQGSREAAKARLRDRCWDVYGDKASNALTTARRFLSEDDSQGAAEVLQETMPWIDLAPPQSQEDVRTLYAEASGAKKLLRFRRGSRR